MTPSASLIVVAGAGRSGTSAVARVLHESGLRMGRSMAEATGANPEGFFEDIEVVNLNERILTDVGLNDPWRPERWPSRATVRSAGAPYHDEMSGLARTGVAGWKDPRFAITLEAWLPALPAPPRVIICLRSPRAYANSVTRIYGLVKPARAMREWARHYRRLLAVIQRHQLAATCVEYDALIEATGPTIARLAAFLNHDLDASLVVPRLRREAGDVPDRFQVLYDQVATLSGTRFRSHAAWIPPASAGRDPTPDYEARARDISERLAAFRHSWLSEVDMRSLSGSERERRASESYVAGLTALQQDVSNLVPPNKVAKPHKLLVRRINLDRMIAELATAAMTTGDPRTREAAQLAWEKYQPPVSA